MRKYILILFFSLSLNAEVVDAIAIVVEDEAITMLDIEKEMQASRIDMKTASDILIRQALEKVEAKKRKIEVSNNDIHMEIGQIARKNNLSISAFYDKIRDTQGISSGDLKEKIKNNLLRKQLYDSISKTRINPPSEEMIKEYYELHKDSLSYPKSFNAIVYTSNNQKALVAKMNNPMLNTAEVSTLEQVIPYDRLPPQLAQIFLQTPKSSFTQIIKNEKNEFISFFIKSTNTEEQSSIERARAKIINALTTTKKQYVLKDYFDRLKISADIKTLRLPKL